MYCFCRLSCCDNVQIHLKSFIFSIFLSRLKSKSNLKYMHLGRCTIIFIFTYHSSTLLVLITSIRYICTLLWVHAYQIFYTIKIKYMKLTLQRLRIVRIAKVFVFCVIYFTKKLLRTLLFDV